MTDVEMDSSAAAPAAEEKKEEAVTQERTVQQELVANLALISKAASTIEPRFTNRVLRTLTSLRRKLDKKDLKAVIQALPAKTAEPLLQHLNYSDSTELAEKAKVDNIPENIVYLRLLLILLDLDNNKAKEAGEYAMETVEYASKANKRTLDQITAKVFFYLARAYEIQGRLAELQPILLSTRQTASLRKDEALEATVINLLLRSYLAQHQYEQADKLIARSTFPAGAPQAQVVRWLFYAGRLRAVQLNYAQARDYLQTAIRRAPKDELAPGFVQLLHKFYIVVILLTGAIPDRATFRKPVLKEALTPYFQIVQAVRIGDVTAFQKAFTTYESTFSADSTHFLILRLRHFVIKTALRTITLAYSRISLRDVCHKLRLDSEEDTEYIVAKAIKDGVIDASIDHAGGFMQSKVSKDMYETDEPQKEFTMRIDFCTQVYNESVRAMRYPSGAHRKDLESAADARERDREIAQAIQEEMDDDDEF